MRGYWHIAALATVTSILTIIFGNYLFVIALFLWLIYLYYNKRLGKLPLFIALTFFLFFSLYIPSIDKTTSSPHTENTQQVFHGKIVRPLLITPSKVDFIMKDETLNEKLLFIYFLNDDEWLNQKTYKDLAYGAKCIVNGKIDPPSVSRNPGQFDFNHYLKSQGISNQVIVGSLADIECEGASLFNKIFLFRSNILAYVSDSMSDETSVWLSALVLGDDSLLEEKIVDLFQRWGLSHILAISGLHVGLIVGLVYFFIVKLGIVTKEKAQWIMIFFLPVYALVAGGQPSVWRASLMVLAFIVLNKIKLKLSMTDVLSLIFILLIILDKYIIYHVGFQLSFAVTFGLILSKDLLSSTSSVFFQGLFISFISQMMILPIQLVYFSFFQPLSILVNVIVVPYFSLIVIPLMFLMLIFSPLFPFFIHIFDQAFSSMHKLFIACIQWFDNIANFPIVIGDFPIIMVILYFVGFYFCMYYLQKKKLVTSFTYGMLLTVVLMSLILRPYISPVGTVTMLDIGQGDTFVIELPYRRGVFLVDAGSGFSFTDFESNHKVFKQVIKPYLYSRGITEIDAIFISHEDIDHMGSVEFLVEEMSVDQIMISHYYELDANHEKHWEENGVQITKVNAGETIMLGSQSFHVLGPVIDKNSANENSLVVYTTLGGMNWLFTGDIGKATERELLNNFQALPVDVLKVAHHGSNTSTDEWFVESIHPTYALISVGVNNSFGHPTKEVLQTLEDLGVYTLRTDINGAVQFKYTENDGTFFKYLP